MGNLHNKNNNQKRGAGMSNGNDKNKIKKERKKFQDKIDKEKQRKGYKLKKSIISKTNLITQKVKDKWKDTNCTAYIEKQFVVLTAIRKGKIVNMTFNFNDLRKWTPKQLNDNEFYAFYLKCKKEFDQ